MKVGSSVLSDRNIDKSTMLTKFRLHANCHKFLKNTKAPGNLTPWDSPGNQTAEISQPFLLEKRPCCRLHRVPPSGLATLGHGL